MVGGVRGLGVAGDGIYLPGEGGVVGGEGVAGLKGLGDEGELQVFDAFKYGKQFDLHCV